MPRFKVCEKKYAAWKFNQKACSDECEKQYHEDNPVKYLNQVSNKRGIQNEEYLRKRKLFLIKLENRRCPVTKDPTTEIHHINGRTNDRLLDEDYWLAVSEAGHKWIHNNPEKARKKGWLI